MKERIFKIELKKINHREHRGHRDGKKLINKIIIINMV